jgi:hypothetical protein
MKYFILVSVDQPTDGEWCESAEFKLSEDKEEIQKEFENAIVDGEYPFVLAGSVSAQGVARMDVSYESGE